MRCRPPAALQSASTSSSASSRIAELEERRREAEEGRSLAHFLVERSDSDDYSQHLGLVSTIRADLESLAKRLDAGIGSDKRRIERIVLYIDDLDRCSSKQVRAVLEAVHLLLAYPLFVVVVGVDPRWLQYALHEEFPAFRKDTEAKVAIGRPTPQNYLEKIFQIPFSLRPMSETGFEKLVTRLMGTTGSERATGSAGSGSQERSPSDSGPVDGGNDAGPRPGHGIEDPPPKGPDGDKGEPKSGVPILETRGEPTPPEFRIHDAAMVIQPWETAFAVRLYGLVPTPRALKRFTNLYRILKAPIPQADLPGFEGTEQLPGEFQVPMLLLALQIGLPGGQILRDLYADAQEGRDVLIALKEMDGPAADTEKVREVTQNTPLPGDPALYLKWIPRVARFSFNLSSSLSLPARV